MKRLLERRDRWGNPAAVWILAAATFVMPLIAYGMTFVRIENNTEHWLPDHDALARTFAWYKNHFPSEEKVLVSWRGAQLSDERFEEIADRLRGETDSLGIRRHGSPYVREVLTPSDGIAAITKRDVPRDEAVRRLTGLLVGQPRDGSDESRPAALIVTLSDAGEKDEAAAVEAIKTAAIAAGVPRSELALGGSPVAGSALNAELRKASWNDDVPTWMLHRRSPILLSMAVAVVIAFVLLRSVRVTALVLGATLLATLGTVALVPATGGGMNMVLVIMPTLMMVLTLSAAMHMVHYRDRAAHAGEADPAAAAVRSAWAPTLIAESTTAIGLASLITSPLAPIRDFGIYSAVGCMILLPVVLLLIPAVLQLWPFPVAAEQVGNHRAWRRLGYWLVKHRSAVTTAAMGLLLLGTGGLYWFQTETRAIRYLSPHSRVVRDYEFLEQELAGIVPVETVISFDAASRERLSFIERMELVRAATEALRRHPEVSGALSLADFLPESQRPPAGASFAAKAAYHRRAAMSEERAKAAGSDAAVFVADCRMPPESRIAGRPSIRTGDELWRVTAHAALMSDADLSTLVSELDATVTNVLATEQGTTHVLTGAVPLFLRTQEALLDSLISSFVAGFVMIAAVIAWMLRSVRAGLIAMLPNVLPVALVFGAVSASGIAFDVGTMITASIAIGVSVDGTLHLCEAFREELAKGVSRRRAVAESLAACGPALWRTVLVVSGGWMMLAGAELLLVARFGWLMAVLVAAALVGDLLVLPALLAGPLGRLLQSRRVRSKSSAATEPPIVRTPVPAPHAWPGGTLAAGSRHAYHSED